MGRNPSEAFADDFGIRGAIVDIKYIHIWFLSPFSHCESNGVTCWGYAMAFLACDSVNRVHDQY